MNAEKKTIVIQRQEIEVTQEVYEAYWDGYNEMENIRRSNLRHQVMHYDADDTEGGLGVEKYPSSEVDVEIMVEKKLLMELLKVAISELNEDEKGLVESYYFNEESFRKIAIKRGVDHKTVSLMHKKILEKLHKELED